MSTLLILGATTLKKPRTKGFQRGYPKSVYFLGGAPDIIIKSVRGEKNEGLFSMTSVEEVCNDDKGPSNQTESSEQ